jgi:hypothetical protein
MQPGQRQRQIQHQQQPCPPTHLMGRLLMLLLTLMHTCCP